VLVSEDPGDTAAWDRLAELALARGDGPSAERFRRRKTEVITLMAQYSKLIDRDDRADKAGDLAALATALGRKDEARGWSLVRDGQGGRQPLDDEEQGAKIGPTLAALFADLRPMGPAPSGAKPGGASTIPVFRDDARAAGLGFVYDNGHTSRKPAPPEAMGGGRRAAGTSTATAGSMSTSCKEAPFPSGQASSQEGDRLLRNKGDGTFEDVTQRSKLAAFGARGTAMESRSATTTTTAGPTSSSTLWAGRMHFTATKGTARSTTYRPRRAGRRSRLADFRRVRRPRWRRRPRPLCLPFTLNTTRPTPGAASHPDSPGKHDCNPLDFDALSRPRLSQPRGRPFVDIT